MGASSNLELRLANYADPDDAAGLVELLDQYAQHPMGGGCRLPDHVRRSLVTKLSDVPGAFTVLGFADARPVALANCLLSFSTFNAAPRVNVHDLFVEEAFRGRGAGRRLLQAVRDEAERRGACAVTLEVRHDNAPACHLYSSLGFEGIGQPTVPMRPSGKSVHFFGVLSLAESTK